MNKKELSKYFSKLGKKGGKTTSERMTSEQKKERAMKGVAARRENRLTKQIS